MLLRELIQGMGIVEVEGPIDREITGITTDSRRVMPGMIFLAAPVDNGEVQAEIENALSRGAVAILCEEKRMVRQRATKIEVSDINRAIIALSKNFHEDPSVSLRVIAVAGTIGQNPTASILKQLLDAAGLRSGLIGSERSEIGERRLPAGRHFPDGCELQSYLGQMVRAGCGACVIELTREQLLDGKLDGIHLDALVLAQLESNSGIARESETGVIRSLAGLSSPRKPPCAIINIDEPTGKRILEKAQVRLTYGFSEQAEVRANHLVLKPHESTFTLEGDGKKIECRLPLVGLHNIYHLLAAAGAAFALDLPIEAIKTGLRQIRPTPGNLELVSGSSRIPVYVDGARTPDTLWQVTKAMKAITAGRLFLVFGCPEKTSARFRFDMGRIAAQCADHIVLTGDNPGKEPVPQICSVIAQGIEQTAHASFEVQADRAQAIYRAIQLGQPGDTIIIAGKGDRTYQELADTLVPFDDRDCARECLEEIIEPTPRGRNIMAFA